MKLKSVMNKYVGTFILFACISGSLIAQPEVNSNNFVLEGIVGVVGSNIILKSEIEAQHENMVRQGLMENTLEDVCEVFEEMLFEKLLIHQADLDSVVVSEEEIESNIERRLGMIIQQIGSEKKLEEFYKKSIVEIKEEMRELIGNQLVAQKMQRTISENIEITPAEVQEFFNKIPVDSVPVINAEVELSQIVIYPVVSQEAKDEAKEKLAGYKARIEKGSSFSSLAVLYSEDPGSARNGGEYKGIKRGVFVKEFEAVAFNLKKGQVSDPFETEHGFHIVQLLQRRGEELDVRHILIKPKISEENLNDAQKKLDSIRDMIDSEIYTFDVAAEKFSMDDESRYNGGVLMNMNTGDARWEIGQLERDVFIAIQDLENNEMSGSLFFRKPDGKEGFRLIKITYKREPHRANLNDDFARIKGVALNAKSREQMNKWINEKLKNTHVKINNNYFDCNFKNSWITQVENESNEQ